MGLEGLAHVKAFSVVSVREIPGGPALLSPAAVGKKLAINRTSGEVVGLPYVVVVDHRAAPHDLRIGRPVVELRRRSVRNTGVFSWALPTNTMLSSRMKCRKTLGQHRVLALSFAELHQHNPLLGHEVFQRRDEASRHRGHQGAPDGSDAAMGSERANAMKKNVSRLHRLGI